MKKWSIRLAWSVALVFATLVVGGALDARWRLSDLKPWHHAAPGAEFRAGDLDDAFTLSTYLQREDEVFRQVEDEVEASLALEDQTPVNRYFPGSRSHYSRVGRDWNRSFELEPSEVRGGALLVHGLTDSPYSMRAVAEVLRDWGTTRSRSGCRATGPCPPASSRPPGRTGSRPSASGRATCGSASGPTGRWCWSATRTAARSSSSTRSTSSMGRAILLRSGSSCSRR